MAERRAELALAVAGCLYCAGAAAGDVLAVDVYGSLRTQLETVSPDRRDRLGAYTSVRDAYSRLGVKVEHPLGAAMTLTGQVEVPADSANLRLRDPYDQGGAGRAHGQPIRIAQLGLQGRFGAVVYGQQWMPYYNVIAAPVDMFSSYYTGFATYTVFRAGPTLSYATPQNSGVSLAVAYSGSRANLRSTSRIDARRWQATATYEAGKTRFAAGIDDRGDAGYGHNRLYGFSASHQAEQLYLALKVELFDTGNRQAGGFSTDGNRAINLFGSYTVSGNTFKLMLARVRNYGGHIFHAGLDHRLADNCTLFAEFYRERETAALTPRRGGLDDFDAGISGGRAIAVGVRYDF